MIWLSEIALIIFNIGMAKHHANLMKKDRPIKHGWWGLMYIASVAILSYLFGSIIFIGYAFLIRKTVFDVSLNLFNDRAIFFVSKETTSLIDKWHYKIFGVHSEIYQSLYFVAAIILGVWAAK